MTLFRWGKDAPKPPDLEIPGDTPASPAGGQASAVDSASAAIIAERKTRRDKGISRGPRGEKLSDSEKTLLATFEKLYDPEVWEGVVCAPADTMLAISGRKLWAISDKERKTLAVTSSMTARCFAVENPKWLALIMLSITLGQIYGTRAMMHMAEVNEEKKRAKQEPHVTAVKWNIYIGIFLAETLTAVAGAAIVGRGLFLVSVENAPKMLKENPNDARGCHNFG